MGSSFVRHEGVPEFQEREPAQPVGLEESGKSQDEKVIELPENVIPSVN